MTPDEIEKVGERIRQLLSDAFRHQRTGDATAARAVMESAAADFQFIQSQTGGGHPYESLGPDLWNALQTVGFDEEEVERRLSAPGAPASRWKRKDKEEKVGIPGLKPGGATHRDHPRGSTEEPHQYGEAGKQRSFGGEDGDARRDYPRKRPPNHPGGPWPPKYVPISDAQRDYEQAICYELGMGVIADPERAFALYLQAAEARHLASQIEVARCFYWGIGTDRNHQAAVGWYRIAAEGGDADSQYAIGCALEYGEGIQRSQEEALLWYKGAALQGHDEAQRAATRLESK